MPTLDWVGHVRVTHGFTRSFGSWRKLCLASCPSFYPTARNRIFYSRRCLAAAFVLARGTPYPRRAGVPLVDWHSDTRLAGCAARKDAPGCAARSGAAAWTIRDDSRNIPSLNSWELSWGLPKQSCQFHLNAPAQEEWTGDWWAEYTGHV